MVADWMRANEKKKSILRRLKELPEEWQRRLTFSRGDRFYTQATGQPKVEMFPESPTEFFLKVVNAQLTFVKDATGHVTHVILHQGGRDQKAERMEGEAVKKDKNPEKPRKAEPPARSLSENSSLKSTSSCH